MIDLFQIDKIEGGGDAWQTNMNEREKITKSNNHLPLTINGWFNACTAVIRVTGFKSKHRYSKS